MNGWKSKLYDRVIRKRWWNNSDIIHLIIITSNDKIKMATLYVGGLINMLAIPNCESSSWNLTEAGSVGFSR